MGKIGLVLSPQNSDVIYAAIELDRRTGGVYKSIDQGANWKKMSDAVAGGTGLTIIKNYMLLLTMKERST